MHINQSYEPKKRQNDGCVRYAFLTVFGGLNINQITFGPLMLISWHGKLEFNINSAPLSFVDGSIERIPLSSLSPSTIRLHRRTFSFGNVANLSLALSSLCSYRS